MNTVPALFFEAKFQLDLILFNIILGKHAFKTVNIGYNRMHSLEISTLLCSISDS